MQGSLQRLVEMFSGDDTCLVIPVYQRNYDWKQENCARLFDDLVATVRENRPHHFFGAIVYKNEGQIGESTIIDGQQRLTTVNLLFLALYRHVLDGGEPDASLADRIFKSYLQSEYAADGHKLKLKPVKADADAYTKLFGPEEYFDDRSNVTANFRYFRQRLAQREITPHEVFDALRKLQVMRLQLEESDDAQLIFESLNSTGLDLTSADMIRNYVLMGQDRATQEHLYEEYWNRIEEAVEYKTTEFIRQFLAARLTRIPATSALYEEFKRYTHRPGVTILGVLSELRDFAGYYRDLHAATLGDVRVNRLMRRCNLVDREVTMPFLMPIVADVRQGRLSYADLLRILQAVDSYLTRRWVCGYPTNALAKTFALLYREADRLSQQGAPLPETAIYLLLNRQGSATFPADDEFRESLETKDFYHVSAAQRNYFWESLENGTSNDVRDIAGALLHGDVSIEHVMPQTLTTDWREELGPAAHRIQAEWLHRLGNLTVTGYNASYSNASFASKRDRERGFRDSPYRVNELLRDADGWGEAELQRRSAALAGKALQYWPLPTSSYAPAPDARDAQPMGTDTVFTGRVLRAWEFRGGVHPAESWKQMLIAVTRLLAEDNLAALYRRGGSAYGWHIRPAERQPAEDFTEVAPGLDVATSNPTAAKVLILRELFNDLDINPDDLVFHLTPIAEDRADADA